MSDERYSAAELVDAARDAGMTPADYLQTNHTPRENGAGASTVTRDECERMRERILVVNSVSKLSEEVNFAPTTIRRHVKARCAHDSDAPGTTYDFDLEAWRRKERRFQPDTGSCERCPSNDAREVTHNGKRYRLCDDCYRAVRLNR